MRGVALNSAISEKQNEENPGSGTEKWLMA
jgi:hypothetical protein